MRQSSPLRRRRASQAAFGDQPRAELAGSRRFLFSTVPAIWRSEGLLFWPFRPLRGHRSGELRTMDPFVLCGILALALQGEVTGLGSEPEQHEERHSVGFASLETPEGFRLKVTEARADVLLGYLERLEDGFKINFAGGQVGDSEGIGREFGVVAWTLQGRSTGGLEIEARLVVGDDGGLRVTGRSSFLVLAATLERESDIGVFLQILRSVGRTR